jgi:hypothetical protein
MAEEPTLRGLLGALALGALNSIRQNKLAAALAVFACVGGTYLAFSIQYDERPRYREAVLPDIKRAEAEFFKALDAADRASTDLWRLQYFLIAHGKAKDVLRIAKESEAVTPEGIRAHSELIRYYSLVNENIAIIRTEMSINQKLDFLGEWKKVRVKLEPIRNNWLIWVEGNNK